MTAPARDTRPRLGLLQFGIIALTAATALIHIWLAIPDNLIIFYLNGLGYLALVTALYLPQLSAYHRLVRYALIAFAAVTIVGWAIIGERSAIAYVDKLIEVALIVLLVIELRTQRD